MKFPMPFKEFASAEAARLGVAVTSIYMRFERGKYPQLQRVKTSARVSFVARKGQAVAISAARARLPVQCECGAMYQPRRKQGSTGEGCPMCRRKNSLIEIYARPLVGIAGGGVMEHRLWI